MAFFDRIAQDLIADPFFNDYTYRKRDTAFIRKFDWGYKRISLDHFTKYGFSEYGYVSVEPGFDIRFSKVKTWYENFCSIPLRDQRDDYTLGFTGGMLGSQTYFTFELDGSNYSSELRKLKNTIYACSEIAFKRFGTLNDAYEYAVRPILDGEKKLDIVSYRWLYEHLAICRAVAPQRYGEFKSMVLDKWYDMVKKGYPVIVSYNNELGEKLNEAISYMESLDFDKMK